MVERVRPPVPRRTTPIVADASVALGFLDREGDRYRNAPVSQSRLTGRGPDLQGQVSNSGSGALLSMTRCFYA